MPFILCHAPKGGTGTSFLAAHLALALAEAGHDVTAIDFTRQDAMKLSFGMAPIQPLPDLESEETLKVAGVWLKQGHRASNQPDFPAAAANGELPLVGEAWVIADVASGDVALRDLLLPHAALMVVPVVPTALGLAALTQVVPGTPLIELDHTAFIVNRLDETRRFARNAHSFLRELLGGKVIGHVHEDEAVNEATAMGQMLPRYAAAAASVALADIRALATTIAAVCGQPGAQEEAA